MATILASSAPRGKWPASVSAPPAQRPNEGTIAYTYDAESQIKTAAGVTYAHDGDHRRVYKSSGKLYWYGADGDILAETDGSCNTIALRSLRRRAPYTNTCRQNYKFEGQERDTETGNDDFGTRSHASRFGRWQSADRSDSTPKFVRI